APYQKRNI
nr:RecName: Full=44 kDa immunogenic protein [Porphyromonas gingivalis]